MAGRSPKYNLSLSRKVGDGYKKASLGGLWKAGDKAPEGIVLSGSLSGEYLEDAAKFLSKAADKDATVYINVWEFKKKRRDEDEEDEDDEKDEDDDEEDEKDEDDEEEEKDEDEEDEPKPKKKKTKKSKKEDEGEEDLPF